MPDIIPIFTAHIRLPSFLRNAFTGATAWIALLAAGIALPILVITVLFVRDIDRLALAARSERAGITHLRALDDVYRDASTYRSALACGRAPGPTAKIDADIAAMDALERKQPFSGADWNAAAATWRAGGAPLWRADALVRGILPLFINISDHSGMTYDPEVAGISFADALTYRLPRAIDALQRIELDACSNSAVALDRRPLTIARLSGALDASLTDAYADFDGALALERALPAVVRRNARASFATDATFVTLRRFELHPTPPLARAAASDAARSYRALYGLTDETIPALDRIVTRRIERLQRRHALTLIPGIVSMLAAAFFVLFGTRSVLQRAELSRVKRSAQELAYHAKHDALTSLPNRAAFLTSLETTLAASSQSGGAAVLFIDLDNFKIVNDSLGHAAGDLVLCSISERLTTICRDAEAEIVARFGGDEFAMLVYDGLAANLADRLDHIVSRIQSDLQQPIALAEQDIVVSASVGIATLFDGERSEALAADLVRDADVAMYEAKARGRARAATFGPAMHERAKRKLKMTTDLRGAAARNEFVLAYEPIVRLRDGVRFGAEALIRWQHPGLGLLTPGAFLPVADESGAIVQIGRWVLDTALEDFPRCNDRFVHVNLSVKDLVEDSLLQTVTTLLERHHVRPQSLSIEVTEGSLVRSGGRAEETLERLRALGVRIWIDDFGVEYSSLRYLDRLPVDGVKIDRSFIGGEDGRLASPSIVKMVLELAKSFGLDVIAEGIETVAQRDALVELGCVYGQGYLYTLGEGHEMLQQPAVAGATLLR